MIRVVIVDDHELVREGLAELLAFDGDIEVAATASDGSAAVSVVGDAEPDVVLMDLSMPDVDGIEATRRVLADHPGMRVVALTSFSEGPQVLGALDAGAIGYVLKDTSPGDLRAAVRAAARGESPLSPKVAGAVIASRERPRAAAGLSEREREVVALVAEGLPNKLIARRLEISEKTVKAHLTSVFQQIGVTDRTQAALWASRHGLGPPEV